MSISEQGREEMAQEVGRIANRIAPILAGHSPAVQSAVLADLLATWLGGHQIVDGTPEEYEELRFKLMSAFVELVGKLAMANDKMREFRKKRMQ